MVTARRLAILKKSGGIFTRFWNHSTHIAWVLAIWLGLMVGLLLEQPCWQHGVKWILYAAPAAVRIALPKANPSYYLTASLGITFPFNITIGIPIYYLMATWMGA